MPLKTEYTETTKYILPLLDDNLTLEDISPDRGFINAYTADINNPQNEKQIFLVYDDEKFFRTETSQKMKLLDTYHHEYKEKIGDKLYKIVSLIIRPSIKHDVADLKDGKLTSISSDSKIEILRFWNKTPEVFTEIVGRLFKITFESYLTKCINDVIPESQYRPSAYDVRLEALNKKAC